jgi:hypothetical protein
VPTLLGAEGPFYQKKNDMHTFAEGKVVRILRASPGPAPNANDRWYRFFSDLGQTGKIPNPTGRPKNSDMSAQDINWAEI